ncbi:MAG TPA: hypothetical protein VFG64_07175, partial [Dongiaceae bacterium]|nr:hypothetical protein [Dongiaceae bacterium]
MAKTKSPASAKPRKASAAALKAHSPKIKVTDSKITPQPPKAYAAVSVRDSRTNTAWDLPVLKGTIGPDVVDVRKLYTEHGLFTYDPGYGSTGSTQSSIT